MMRKLKARKLVRALPHRDAVPTESHNDGQHAGYFPRTLRTLLLVLGYSTPWLFIGTLGYFVGLVPLVCVCDHLQQAYDRPYLPHLPCDRGFHTEVDVRGRHERGSPRRFGCSVT
jgi:hypothetical protein